MEMWIKSIAINKLVNTDDVLQELSFDALHRHLNNRKITASTGDAIIKLVADHIGRLEQQYGTLSSDNLTDFSSAFSLIYGLSNNLTALSSSGAWGIGFPIPTSVIAGTASLYRDVELPLRPLKNNELEFFYKEINWPNKILYALILDRLYGIPMTVPPFLYEYVNEGGVKRYFELEVDFSFVDVEARLPLPKIDFSCIRHKEITEHSDIEPFLKNFPLESFKFKGFSMLKLEDCTERYVADKIQYIIANLTTYTRSVLFQDIDDCIASVIDNRDIKCTLFPILYLNGVPIVKADVSSESTLFDELSGLQERLGSQELIRYLESPYIISYGFEQELEVTDPYFLNKIKANQNGSYACFPLKHNQNLVGFLELSTGISTKMDRSIFSRLSPFYPLLTQLAYDLRLEFKNRLDAVIMQQFTALQPAVQWRFNQAAATFLKNKENEEGTHLLPEDIGFTDVYPLYGAIDVRDSTLLRNLAFRKDNKKRLEQLQQIFIHPSKFNLSDRHAFASFLKRMDMVDGWLLTDNATIHMQDIVLFFQEEVPTFLKALEGGDPVLDERIARYHIQGHQDHYQQAFENSLQRLNALINEEILVLNELVQNTFPSYFEKFRTDGIEYDIYVGQSISPIVSFDKSVVNEFRRQQIISMARICERVSQLSESLPVTLSTTQLIFVHPTRIDISFRHDEKRFDVEGGYNIRYQVIKKRIDKILIKNKKERLVQPGKIAIVTNGSVAFDELHHELYQLAELGILSKKIELLELEELQGVSGLKAFRVEVCSTKK
ncbi:hypothetical protein [Sphingobacterium sp. LRF_L2]|uniref:hypothetical protein n=1 Tax=Sphingobacterium sp. LRF_L2 TaxID=3369421 RepID=UPI003F61A55C